jgi:hypothetical protein
MTTQSGEWLGAASDSLRSSDGGSKIDKAGDAALAHPGGTLKRTGDGLANGWGSTWDSLQALIVALRGQ